MSGTVAPATFENTMPVNSLIFSLFSSRSAICLPCPGLAPSSSTITCYGNTAELAAPKLDREPEAIADILTEIPAGAGQRGDHADLDWFLDRAPERRAAIGASNNTLTAIFTIFMASIVLESSIFMNRLSAIAAPSQPAAPCRDAASCNADRFWRLRCRRTRDTAAADRRRCFRDRSRRDAPALRI